MKIVAGVVLIACGAVLGALFYQYHTEFGLVPATCMAIAAYGYFLLTYPVIRSTGIAEVTQAMLRMWVKYLAGFGLFILVLGGQIVLSIVQRSECQYSTWISLAYIGTSLLAGYFLMTLKLPEQNQQSITA